MTPPDSHASAQGTEATDAPSGPSESSPDRPRRRGGSWILWILVIGGLAYVQWPMVKGMYYKATGSAAPASTIAWRTSFDDALAEAGKTGKPVLVDFTASWCPPCKVMKHDVWPDDEVARAVTDGFVPLLIDVDEPQHAALSQRYGIRSIPTILIMDAGGEVLHAGMFMSRGEMLKFLKRPSV